MNANERLAQGWCRKADSDLATVQLTLHSEGPYDTACFHAQQVVEKFPKDFLALRGQVIPRRHDLEVLAERCSSLQAFDFVLEALAELSYFAVEIRYDFEV